MRTLVDDRTSLGIRAHDIGSHILIT
jgi:hypothetical protein